MKFFRKERHVRVLIGFWTLFHAWPLLLGMCKTFGGFTLYLCVGGWQNRKGIPILEVNWVVEAHY